jgi:hypothetical protein
MPSNTPINRNRYITVFDTDAERAATPPNSIPFGQFVYSIDTRQLRICDGTAVWPAPIGGANDGPVKLARLCSLIPLPLTGAVALVDGVAPVAGDVLAAFGQVGDAGNGLYVYDPFKPWLRAPDFNDSDEVKTGSLVVIEEGVAQKNLVFELTTPQSAIPVGPIAPLLPLAFVEVAGPFANTAQSVGAANAGGTSELMSRGDHVHEGVHSVTAGVGLTNSGTATDPILDAAPAATPNLAAVLAVGNDSGPNSIVMPPAQRLDTDVPGTLNLGTTTASAVAMGSAPGTTGTPRVFVNQGGVALHGSNNGMQVSSAVANRGAYRANQYGNGSGVPGITGFKSRGTFVGDLLAVAVDDVLWRATGIGVCGDNASIPLAGMVSINVEAVFPGYVATRFAIQAVPGDGPTFAARREVFAVSSQGVPSLQENANRGAGLVTLGADGKAVVLNANVDGIESRYSLSVQEGTGVVPSGNIYISDHSDGVAFEISSTAGGADQGLVVYWQMWFACAPGPISP